MGLNGYTWAQQAVVESYPLLGDWCQAWSQMGGGPDDWPRDDVEQVVVWEVTHHAHNDADVEEAELPRTNSLPRPAIRAPLAWPGEVSVTVLWRAGPHGLC